jgi:alpha-beta hydrolase superfamily lysophospholipase
MTARRRARAARAGGEDARPSLLWRILRVLIGGALVVSLLISLLPGEHPGVLPEPPVAPGATAAETVASVMAAERLIDGVREGAAKEVVWAGAPGEVTPLSVVYVHGFSATKAELRPVPDRVAEALGANLFLTRLAGHGRTGEALGRAEASHWMLDMAEALAVGKAIGERTLVIGTSTGAALAALSAVEPAGREGVAGYVLVSPNFGLQASGTSLLRLPFARTLAPLILGPERAWEPRNEAHAQGWTNRYPTEALVPMAAVTDAAFLTDYATATAPALFLLSDEDRVVDPEKAREVARRWGPAPGATVVPIALAPGDDPDAHVLAGDALSPGSTDTVVQAILDWAAHQGLGPEGG